MRLAAAVLLKDEILLKHSAERVLRPCLLPEQAAIRHLREEAAHLRDRSGPPGQEHEVERCCPCLCSRSIPACNRACLHGCSASWSSTSEVGWVCACVLALIHDW